MCGDMPGGGAIGQGKRMIITKKDYVLILVSIFFQSLIFELLAFFVLKAYHQLTILSMGMSGDYKLAIAKGSNMIRVGSAIFGARNYIA